MNELFDRKEIKKLALSNMQYSTYCPIEAAIMALEMFLTKKELMIIPKLPEGVKLPDKAD